MSTIELIASLIGGGGVICLIIERLFFRRRDRAEAKGEEIENASSIASLYREVDEIVQSKTKPLEDKIDRLTESITEMKERWCCYREQCKDRILYRNDEEDKHD